MQSIFEIILETILLIIFSYPGAIIRWIVTGFRKPFKEYLNDDAYLNGTIGLLVLSFSIVILKKIF